jgi:hypothetical protein
LNTAGLYNTAIGRGALFSNNASDNTAVGDGALGSNRDGVQNTATGINALANNSEGSSNTAIGAGALFANNTGSNNTAIGGGALGANISGGANTAIGYGALTNSTGSNSIALGTNAGSNVTTAHDVICIGIPGQNVSDSFYVGNVFETSIDADNLPVRIDVRGRLGTQPSSRRFKDDIKPTDKASQAILGLQPVTFHYKDDSKCRPEFGLIAEEVAQVDPNLVARDKEGKPYTVRYDQVNAMLLNEFLKEHKKVQQLEAASAQQRNDFEATIAELRKEIAGVVARSRDQEEKIQKVSAQVELNKTVSRKVANK